MMQKTFGEKLAEERIEKENLEKTYRYATEEIQKLQDNLAQSHNENGRHQIQIELNSFGNVYLTVEVPRANRDISN